ncbi:MAG: tRNA-intron lyase [Candidatus Woesearchaeota archaeon]
MTKKSKKSAAQATTLESFAGDKKDKKRSAKELIEVEEVDVSAPKEEILPAVETNDNEKSNKKKVVVKALLTGEKVITEASDEAREFYNQSRFGMMPENGKVELSLLEGFYLLEKGKLSVKNDAGKKLTFETFLKKARECEPNFWIRYCVFKDIRNRGYIIKTALKFGADFRVYDRGVKPGEDHARWIVYPVHEGDTLTWYEFAAKNRVAHSTKKRLLIGIVDDEGDVTYYEIKWMRP